jgi:hypothetical protein
MCSHDDGLIAEEMQALQGHTLYRFVRSHTLTVPVSQTYRGIFDKTVYGVLRGVLYCRFRRQDSQKRRFSVDFQSLKTRTWSACFKDAASSMSQRQNSTSCSSGRLATAASKPSWRRPERLIRMDSFLCCPPHGFSTVNIFCDNSEHLVDTVVMVVDSVVSSQQQWHWWWYGCCIGELAERQGTKRRHQS